MPEILPSAAPHQIRDELTAMLVNDLLSPAGGIEEELDQREDRVRERYLVGMLAPKFTPGGSLIVPELGRRICLQ